MGRNGSRPSCAQCLRPNASQLAGNESPRARALRVSTSVEARTADVLEPRQAASRLATVADEAWSKRGEQGLLQEAKDSPYETNCGLKGRNRDLEERHTGLEERNSDLEKRNNDLTRR